jgi:hypothetical protein
MNARTRKKLYCLVANRDGDCCKMCRMLPSMIQLILDHIDNNKFNNNPSNLQILCRRCNYLKNPRRPVDQCVNEGVYGTLTELEVNRQKEGRFRDFVYQLLRDTGPVFESDVVYGVAEEIGVSPVTSKRYLDKMASKFGKLERVRHLNSTEIRFKQQDPLS